MRIGKSLSVVSLLALVVISFLGVASPACAVAGSVTLLTTSSGPPGTTIGVTGAGFTTGPAATYTLMMTHTITGAATIVESGNAVTLPAGTFTTAFLAPIVPRGTYTITATTSTGDTTGTPATFTIVPAVWLSVTTGKAGDQVTVSGNGFAASSTVNVYFDGISATPAYTDILGSFSGLALTVPQTTAGAHSIAGIDIYGSSPGATFNVIPNITAVSVTGSTVTCSGTGFAASSIIAFTLDGVAASASVVTDSQGKFTNSTVTLPLSTTGAHILQATDVYGNSATTDITVSAAITVTPDAGIVGSTVTVKGTGFQGNVQVYITYDGSAITTIPASVVTEANGSFTASLKVPGGASGIHNIAVSDSLSTQSAKFTSTANISPPATTSGPAGTSIPITGTGFKAQTEVTIRYDDVKIGTATTDNLGNLNTNLQVPPSRTGSHQFSISDGTNTKTISFVVTPSATINPSTGFVGGEVTITGTGYYASREVTIKYDTQQITATNTDASGSFTATFKAPVSKGGNHNIVISDGTNTNTFTFAMDSTPPPVPNLIFPIGLSKADKAPTLDWEDVNDPSGVTYVLEIATDTAYSIPVLRKTGLTFSVYKLTVVETLKSASKSKPYYWRVKAVDAASNESAWSTSGTFVVGLIIPGWAINTAFGVLAVFLGAGGYILGRKSGRKSSAVGVIIKPETQEKPQNPPEQPGQ